MVKIVILTKHQSYHLLPPNATNKYLWQPNNEMKNIANLSRIVHDHA